MRLLLNAFSLGLTFAAIGAFAHADDFKSDSQFYQNYFKVSSVETHVVGIVDLPKEPSAAEKAANAPLSPYEIADLQPDVPAAVAATSVGGTFAQGISGLGSNLLSGVLGGSSGGALGIAQVALQVWDIIQSNRAVANVDMVSASALPNAANQNWQSITGWKPEKAIRFSTQIKNLYGMTVIDFSYDVRVLSGGTLRGKGLYIASARVLPFKVKVLWGYTLNMNVKVAAIYNARTESNPLAAMDLDVQYEYSSILRKDSGTNSYLVRGDGLLKDVTGNKILVPGSTAVASSH
jgi:hypothetical protein